MQTVDWNIAIPAALLFLVVLVAGFVYFSHHKLATAISSVEDRVQTAVENLAKDAHVPVQHLMDIVPTSPGRVVASLHPAPKPEPAKPDATAADHAATVLTAAAKAVEVAHTVLVHPQATAAGREAAGKLLTVASGHAEAASRAAEHVHPKA